MIVKETPPYVEVATTGSRIGYPTARTVETTRPIVSRPLNPKEQVR
jgi:hypothetical protein